MNSETVLRKDFNMQNPNLITTVKSCVQRPNNKKANPDNSEKSPYYIDI